jgi:hypothetical protein
MDERFEDHPPPGQSNGGPPKPPPRGPLPVGQTAGEVWQTFLGLVRHLPTVALVPFTATFLAQGSIAFAIGNPLAQGDGPPQVSPLLLLPVLVMLAAYTMFLVDWHRLVLFGPGPETTRPRILPTRRDLRFFGRALLVGLLALVAALPVALIAPGLGGTIPGLIMLQVIGTLLSLTVFMACGLVLPAVATDRNYGIGASFEATKEVLPQIGLLIGALLLPAGLVAATIGALASLISGGGGVFVPGMLVNLACEYVVMALGATLLSVIFRKRAGVDIQA